MKKIIISAALACAASVGFAESIIKPMNDKMAENNLGEFSGELRYLWMKDRFSGDASQPWNGSAYAGTASAQLNYHSDEFWGLKLGAQYIYAYTTHSDGEDMTQAWLANGDLNVLNELYLNYNMKALGLEKTDLRVGRQIVESTDGAWQGLDFLVKKDIRHKAQAIEGIVLTSQDIDNLSLSIGHIDKFSNWGWTPREGDGFENVEDAYLRNLGFTTGNADLSGISANKGTQFISATYTGFEGLALTVYDFYAHDIINTIGTKAVYNIADATSLKVHYVHQDSIGETDSVLQDELGEELDSDLLDLSITTRFGSMDVELGYLAVFKAGGDTFGDFIAPFDFFSVPSDQLLVYTHSFAEGAESYYVQGRGMITDNLFLLGMYTYTTHENRDFDAQEVDVILSYDITENFSIATLGAMGWRSGKGNSASGKATDFRLYASYKF